MVFRLLRLERWHEITSKKPRCRLFCQNGLKGGGGASRSKLWQAFSAGDPVDLDIYDESVVPCIVENTIPRVSHQKH